MTAQEFSSALMSGELSLIIGVVLSLVLLALRHTPKLKTLLDPMTMKKEAVALALLVLPAVIPLLLAGAPIKSTLIAMFTAIGVGLGLQSKKGNDEVKN
jgi:hypothetical protein